MSVQPSAARPAGTSLGAAVLGLVLTLVLFVVTFLAFLTVPLLLFGVALAAYLLLRPRGDRTGSGRSGASGRTVVTPSAGSAAAPGRFGSGAR